MRHIRKRPEPRTLADTRCAETTDVTTPGKARQAFDQLDKQEVRAQLLMEQGCLCAFCMRRISQEAIDHATGQPTMKIAHRIPIAADSSQALTWTNFLGSCDGGQRSGGRHWTCDAAQGATALTVDPTRSESILRLRYERRDGAEGLFITSDDAATRADVEQTLALNRGELPLLREAAWKAFLTRQRRAHPRQYGKPARQAFFPSWLQQHGARLPQMLGVIEALIR